MRALISAVLVFATLMPVAKTAPLSEVDLKNLLAGIRQNRTTQADFQEERLIRLGAHTLSATVEWFIQRLPANEKDI